MSANVRSSNRSFGVQALSRINRSIGNKLATSVHMEIHRHELKHSLIAIWKQVADQAKVEVR